MVEDGMMWSDMIFVASYPARFTLRSLLKIHSLPEKVTVHELPLAATYFELSAATTGMTATGMPH
jgi:hypothetical protein